MKDLKEKKFFCIVSFLFFLATLQAQQKIVVDFYATVTNSFDKNTILMTQDLYYSHLASLDDIVLNDRRSTQFNEPDFVDLLTNKANANVENDKTCHIAFYAQITESNTGNGNWTCSLNAVNLLSGVHIKKQDTYSSYYKVLLDAKSFVQQVIYQAAGLEGSSPSIPSAPSSASSASSSSSPPVALNKTPSGTKGQSPEVLSGTWSGEDYIDKIVILRGGRGFVIYKNGASMNISVVIAGDAVEITQVGKSNASFFPELPRDVALKVATDAPAIKWNLTLLDSNLLEGKKTTLALQDGTATESQVAVSWKRQ